MANLTNIRLGTSVYFDVTLSDSQVPVNWSDLVIRDVFMYSESQRAFSGRCTYAIDGDDDTLLHVTYAADKQQYLGIHRLVIRVELEGTVATYDAQAVNIVANMDGLADPTAATTVGIGIEVQDVDITIMHEILRACQEASDKALVAAGAQPIIHAETPGGPVYWFVWSFEYNRYVNTGIVARGQDGQPGANGLTPHIGANGNWFIGLNDTGVHAQGEQGEQGASGNINYPTFEVNAAMHLIIDSEAASDADHFEIDSNGHLQLTI